MKIDSRIIALFTEGGAKHYKIHIEMMKLFSMFGYLSSEELKYHFKGYKYVFLMNRLYNLYKYRIVDKFLSLSIPKYFYYITGLGRDVVEYFQISDFISNFYPAHYSLANSYHHRKMINVYSVFKRVLVDLMKGWTVEEMLKREETGAGAKVFDAEVFVSAVVKICKKLEDGSEYDSGQRKYRDVRMMIELETSLKTPRRYEKLANVLTDFHMHRKRLGREAAKYIFICKGETIKDRIRRHLVNRIISREAEIVFIDLDELIEKEGEAIVEDIRGERSKFKEIYIIKEYVEGML